MTLCSRSWRSPSHGNPGPPWPLLTSRWCLQPYWAWSFSIILVPKETLEPHRASIWPGQDTPREVQEEGGIHPERRRSDRRWHTEAGGPWGRDDRPCRGRNQRHQIWLGGRFLPLHWFWLKLRQDHGAKSEFWKTAAQNPGVKMVTRMSPGKRIFWLKQSSQNFHFLYILLNVAYLA